MAKKATKQLQKAKKVVAKKPLGYNKLPAVQ